MHEDYITSLTADTLLQDETFLKIFEFDSNLEKEKYLANLRAKAAKFGMVKVFNDLYKAWQLDFVQKTKTQESNLIEFARCPLPGLYCGEWIATDLGVIRYERVNGQERRTVTACPHPILPVERLVNIDTETEKIKLAFFKDGRWQTVTVDRSVCANKGKIIDLADRGIEVTSETARELVRYLSDVVSLNMAVIPVYQSISRCGWIEKTFAPYCTDIKYDGDQNYRLVYDAITQCGDSSAWVRMCTKLRKNPYLRMQMAASFASPLLEKLGVLPFVLHIWGGTGTGKTVGLMVAMSVWGNPELGQLVKTMNMTANSMTELAAFLHNLPFAGDELQIIKDRWNNYDSLIMYLTEGINRGRLHSTGRMEQQKTWKNSFLFTGEEPITKSQSGGGAKNRVIEIGLTGDDKVVENGNEISNFVRENYGFAGQKFIQCLSNWDLKGRYKELFDSILEVCDTTEKQAMAMACLLLADEIATAEIFSGEQPLTVEDAKSYLTASAEVDMAARAYDWTLNWIAKNMARFRESDNNGEIWGKIVDGVAVINRDVLAEGLRSAGFDYTAVIGKFADRGQIVRNSQGKFVHCTHVFGVKASYVKLLLSQEDSDDLLQEDFPF